MQPPCISGFEFLANEKDIPLPDTNEIDAGKNLMINTKIQAREKPHPENKNTYYTTNIFLP